MGDTIFTFVGYIPIHYLYTYIFMYPYMYIYITLRNVRRWNTARYIGINCLIYY